MKSSITFVAVAITLATPALARAASVELRNVYANVEVIPEDRADITVDVRSSDKRLPATRITRADGNVLVDGELSPLHGCGGIEPGHSVRLPGLGWTPASSALKITLHTPREARITASGAIIGNIHPAQGVDLRTTGCSQWHIADVSGALTIDQAGASSITVGSAGRTALDLSGLTHVEMGAARGLDVDMSGMGKVNVRSISGSVSANLSGMGSVRIAGGRADRVKADVSGLGGFNLHGSASELDAEVSGVGGVHVDHVDGAVHKSVSGIGHVSVGS